MERRFLTILVVIFLCSQSEAFCGSKSLHASLTRSAVRAAEWLRNQQDVNGTYGEGHESAFAFHSLRLIGHSVENGADHLNAEIIKKGLGSIPGGRVGHYIHGVLATCGDPQRFHDFNLVRALHIKLKKFPQPGFDDYFKYSLAVLALCSAGNESIGQSLYPYMVNITERITERAEQEYVDTLAYQVMALSCMRSRGGKKRVQKKILKAINAGSKELIKRLGNDSSVSGNEVSTALVSQALLAAKGNKWKSSETLKWLQSRQNPDGSFSSLMSTVHILPTLIGALPYEVRDILCTTGFKEQAQMIDVCLELEFDANKYTSGKTPPPPQCVTVLNGTNAHEILKLAANQHPCFNFTTLKTGYGHMITSICDINQRLADKLHWSMKIDGQSALVGIDDLKPRNGSTLLFQYKKGNW